MKLNATIEVSTQDLRGLGLSIEKRLGLLRGPVHGAMANQFRQTVYDNLGATGLFRPHLWASLSPTYARKVKRTYATLNVSGALRAGIKRESNEVRGRVSISNNDVAYALAHQWGNPKGNLPDRPYFPIHKDGKVLQAVKDLVLKAARLALTNKLKPT